jgi:DNA ligase (NAD+)
LIDLEKQHPEYITDDSPSKRVGGYIATHFKKIKHQIPMLSLSNVFNADELRKFDDDIRKITRQTTTAYNIEPKIDGLSISLIYQNGKLTNALTRGDGEYGEDITMNAKTIKSIPLNINTDLKELEVRGEVYMSFKEFEKINSTLDEQEQFANPRNAAAGSLRNLDSAETAKRNLEMIAYYIPDETILNKLEIKTQSGVIEQLKKWGFKTAAGVRKLNDIDEVIKYINDFTTSRNQLPFPTDGAVIKLNDISYYDTLGRTSKFPK